MRRLFLALMFSGLVAACASDSPTSTNPAGGLDPAQAGTLQAQLARIGDRVFFETDQWELTPQSRTTIDGWAQLLRQNPNARVTLEGHADERGTREYNIALGERRSNTARAYLVTIGIPAARIQTVSYGRERPAVTESNPDGWAQNRRAVIVVN